MSKHIHIGAPCHEDISTFPRCGKNLYCAACTKNVVDLRTSTVKEAHSFVENNPESCILIHPRHATTRRRYIMVNTLENFWLHLGLKRVALVSSTVLLFVTGCNTRRHTHHPGGKAAIKELKTLPQ